MVEMTEEHVVQIDVRTIILKIEGEKEVSLINRSGSRKYERRTKVNAAVLFTVHWVITPLIILSKGT